MGVDVGNSHAFFAFLFFAVILLKLKIQCLKHSVCVCTILFYLKTRKWQLISCSLNWVLTWFSSSKNQNIQFTRQLPVPPQDPLLVSVMKEIWVFRLKFPSWKNNFLTLVSFPAQFPPTVPQVTMAHPTVNVSVVTPDDLNNIHTDSNTNCLKCFIWLLHLHSALCWLYPLSTAFCFY